MTEAPRGVGGPSEALSGLTSDPPRDLGTDWDALLAADKRRVWHPYAPLPASQPPLPVASAEGVRLRLADGTRLIDGMSSWWCAIHGYRHPALDAAVADQLRRFAHVMFGGLTHEPAILLAERLLGIAPDGLEHVFFADSGSVSVEVAIKMCLQAQRARGNGNARRLLTIRGGYHGDTIGAMGVCDPVDGMHRLFSGTLAEHVFAPRPPDGFHAPLDEQWAAQVTALAQRHSDELAGVILEPVVQGAGGMRFHSPACLTFLRELCDEHGLLLILDEIATGFGRSGAMFACEHASVSPDVMCVGKALTGGYLTLAATLCTSAVAEAISRGEGGALMHGPTFMANPLACSVALASLELLLRDGDGLSANAVSGGNYVSRANAVSGGNYVSRANAVPGGNYVSRANAVPGGHTRGGWWRERVATIERGLEHGLAPAREIDGVTDVRVLGAIGVIQLDREVDVSAATAAAVEWGVWLRPFRDLIYTMPPYVIDEGDLATVAGAAVAAARVSLA